MALTDRERRLLAELETGLTQVSARPRPAHIRAALAANWQLVITVAALLVTFTVLAGLTDRPVALLLASVSGAAAAWAAGVIWRDAHNRAAGD